MERGMGSGSVCLRLWSQQLSSLFRSAAAFGILDRKRERNCDASVSPPPSKNLESRTIYWICLLRFYELPPRKPFNVNSL